MQIRASLTLELSATSELDVNRLEEQVLEAGRQAMKHAILAVTRQYK